ncbi:hypothetical protein BJ742DRAFT_832395 [Cladochytrium replicatum]|nr:hypothetical protein BJ742DRAFT_832395 [Cladochytrium replicatum]
MQYPHPLAPTDLVVRKASAHSRHYAHPEDRCASRLFYGSHENQHSHPEDLHHRHYIAARSARGQIAWRNSTHNYSGKPWLPPVPATGVRVDNRSQVCWNGTEFSPPIASSLQYNSRHLPLPVDTYSSQFSYQPPEISRTQNHLKNDVARTSFTDILSTEASELTLASNHGEQVITRLANHDGSVRELERDANLNEQSTYLQSQEALSSQYQERADLKTSLQIPGKPRKAAHYQQLQRPQQYRHPVGSANQHKIYNLGPSPVQQPWHYWHNQHDQYYQHSLLCQGAHYSSRSGSFAHPVHKHCPSDPHHEWTPVPNSASHGRWRYSEYPFRAYYGAPGSSEDQSIIDQTSCGDQRGWYSGLPSEMGHLYHQRITSTGATEPSSIHSGTGTERQRFAPEDIREAKSASATPASPMTSQNKQSRRELTGSYYSKYRPIAPAPLNGPTTKYSRRFVLPHSSAPYPASNSRQVRNLKIEIGQEARETSRSVASTDLPTPDSAMELSQER